MSTLILAADRPSPVLPDTTELIIGIIAFAILYFIIAKAVVPRFEKLYAERTNRIEGGLKRAEEAQAEANRALEQYRAQLAEARAEAAKIRDTARFEAEQIKEEIRLEAQQESARIVAQGQAQLAAQRAQIVAELRSDLGRLSVELAGKIVGESLASEANRNGTVDRFLDELDANASVSS